MLHGTYVSELRGSLEYLPAWLPTLQIQLGDIVTADRNSLRRTGHVRDYGVTFRSRPSSTRATFEYSSSGAVSVTAKLAGQVIPGSLLGETEAGLIVRFSKENAILFEASGCTSLIIDNLPSLTQQINRLYYDGNWDRSQMVVTELITAAAATIIISSSETAQIDLKATGNLCHSGMGLSDLSAKFETKHTANVGFKVIAESGLTPLYRAGGIRRTWIGQSNFGPRFRSSRTGDFADVSADDLITIINATEGIGGAPSEG